MPSKGNQFSKDCFNCCTNLCIIIMISIGFGLILWSVIAVIMGPISMMQLDSYLSLEEHQCTIVRVEVPEQLPSPEYTNYWKGCTCGTSSIEGHVPCIKYYTDLEPTKMVINLIDYVSLKSYEKETDCTYSSENCQCDIESLNATIVRMAQSKVNETGTIRTCYQGTSNSNSNGNVYFNKILGNVLITVFCLTWGWLVILTCIISIWLWYRYDCKCPCQRKKKRNVQLPKNIDEPMKQIDDKHDIESLVSTGSAPPVYEQPLNIHKNRKLLYKLCFW